MIDFQRIRLLNKEEQDLRWRIIRAEARATRTTTNLTGMPRSGGFSNRMEEVIVEIATMKEAYIQITEELSVKKAELEKAIKVIKNPFVLLSIRMRYINGQKIKEICTALSYSDRQVLRFLKQGEREINRTRSL